MRTLGEDVTEELEYVPGRFVVNRIIRPRMACSCCDAICQSSLPSRPIEKGRPGPGLLAHVLVNKYADHLPLYRQSQIFEREGIDLDRSTLADWIGKSTTLLEPLAKAIERHVLSGQAIFADDTPVKLLSQGAGKTKTARLWAYVRDERPWASEVPPAAFYRFSRDRKGEQPAEHLKDYTGWMHADGYSGFNELVWTASALQGKFAVFATSVGCGHVSGLLTRHLAAGPDEVRGSGLNHYHAVCPHTLSRGISALLIGEVSRSPARPGWHHVIFTLANLCTLSPGFA